MKNPTEIILRANKMQEGVVKNELTSYATKHGRELNALGERYAEMIEKAKRADVDAVLSEWMARHPDFKGEMTDTDVHNRPYFNKYRAIRTISTEMMNKNKDR